MNQIDTEDTQTYMEPNSPFAHVFAVVWLKG